MSRSSFRFLALSFAAAWMAGAGVARAETCQQNQDCPTGFSCVETASGKTTPACGAADQACDPTAGSGGIGGSATTTSIKECQPGACSTDADCGGDTVCHQQTSTTCSGGGAVAPCEANTKCPAIETDQGTCTTTTSGICAFRWQLPCQTDGDCGAGFACHPTVIGSCSGSAGGATGSGTSTGAGTSGSSGAGAAVGKSASGGAEGGNTGAGNASGTGGTGPDTATCTSTEVYPGWCAPKVTTCATDTDCPALWSCASYSYPVRGGSSSTGGTGGSISTEPTKSCVSPYSSFFGTGKDAGGTSNTPAAGGTTGANEGTTGGDGSPRSTSGTGGTTGATTGLVAPADTTQTSGGGCAIGGSSSTALAPAALALLALVLRRRRLSR